MTTATHPFRWRRALAVGAASVLLHYAALDCGAAAPKRSPAAQVTVVATLRSAPPVAAPPAPAPEAGAVSALPLVQLAGPQPAARPQPHYRVSLPPSAELRFDVARGDAGGRALLGWRREKTQYRLTMSTEVGGSTLANWPA